MSKLVVSAKFVRWTVAGYVSVIFALIIATMGQVWRIQLGQDWWIVGNVLSAVTIGWAAALIGFSALAAWTRSRTEFSVFEDRVEYTSRVVRKGSKRIEASQIESVEGAQALLGGDRYGSVLVTGSGGSSLHLDVVENVDELVEAIRTISSASTSKTSPKGPQVSAKSASTHIVPEANEQTSSSSIAREIAQLAELNKVGALSDDEFIAAKKKLLG